MVDEERQGLLQPQQNQQQVQGRQPPLLDVGAALNDLNVIRVVLPTIYYVIVGRGPMAVVNHRTLRASQWGLDRIGGRPVLHVGAPNPWPRYMRHGLGQPNHLLSFPGFTNQPSVGGGVIDGGLDSQHFGGQIDAEFGMLGAEVLEAWVGLIQSRQGLEAVDNRIGNEIEGAAVRDAIAQRIQDPWPDFEPNQAPYRLCLYDPVHQTTRLVYAAAIDICTGPGRPVVLPPANGDSQDTTRARTPPWLCPEQWSQIPLWRDRKTMNGVDAIRDEVQWNAGDRVCVTAGGGVGLNAAEKARNNDCVLDWFGRAALMPIFENPRNITYLRRPGTEQHFAPGRRRDVGILQEDHLIAFSKRHRMGRGAVLAAAETTDAGVDVGLAGDAAIIRDWWGNSSQLDTAEGRWTFSQAYGEHVAELGLVASRNYRRLVIPNGQATNEVGHPRSFAHHLGFQAVVVSNRLVALETADHLVRVLGAACNNYPGFDQGTWAGANRPADGSPANHMWTFHATLPVSAVPDGFIICGVNTAAANRYFVDHPNMNVNTMTREEIFAVVDDMDLATRIVTRRNANNGYLDLVDLRRVVESEAASLTHLRYAYPAAV